jgi:hypothetical protein
VNVDGLVAAPMRWTFAASDKYTKVLALAVKSLPAGSLVLVTCRGKGCPYGRTASSITRSGSTLNLAPKFRKRQLKPGAKITVYVVRTGWLGKYYTFQFRAKKAPKVSNGCLAPGTTKTAAC